MIAHKLHRSCHSNHNKNAGTKTGITRSASPRTSQRLRAMLKPQAEPASPVGNPPLRDRRDHSHTRSPQNHRRRKNDERSLRNLGCFLRLLSCWTNSGVHDASRDARSNDQPMHHGGASGNTHSTGSGHRKHKKHNDRVSKVCLLAGTETEEGREPERERHT